MTFNDMIENPQSKKITIVEIDTPLSGYTFQSLQPGIWYAQLSPGTQTFTDDFGNVGFWGPSNSLYYNIQSLNVDGTLYGEVASIALTVATEKTWFYDTATTNIYIHFEDFNPPEVYTLIAPGAAIGFTFQKDDTSNNYFEDIYYIPSVLSIPNLSKKKDPLFFGVIQYQGGSITFNNEDGYFDNFATLDLYGQPVRIKFTFEGLAFSEQLTVYTGRVEEFAHDLTTFKMQITNLRKLLSRKLPINLLSLTDYPDMDSKLDGTPIPIAYSDIINAPAYRTSPGNFIFADVEFNNIVAGIVVQTKDLVPVTHAGTETDGTFTVPEGTADGATTDTAGYAIGISTINLASAGTGTIVIGDQITIGSDKTIYNVTEGDTDVSDGGNFSINPGLTEVIPASARKIKLKRFEYVVTFTQSSVENGLDIISDILANYESIAFNSSNYDTVEWASEIGAVKDIGIWIGKGSLKTSVDVIEAVCVANNGIFDVLADGRYTFKTLDPDKTPTFEVFADELLGDASVRYPSKEYLSSIKIEYSEDLLEKESELYTNTDYETAVYAKYGQRKETPKPVKSYLTSEADAIILSNSIMAQSKEITPTISLATKTQNIGVSILDNIMFEYIRQNGSVIVSRSRWQVLGISLNMTDFTVGLDFKQIEEDSNIYYTYDGGSSSTAYDYLESGSSTTDYDYVDGGGS